MIDVQFKSPIGKTIHESCFKDVESLRQYLCDQMEKKDLLNTSIHGPWGKTWVVTMPHGLTVEPVYKELTTESLRNDFLDEEEWAEYRRRDELGLTWTRY